MNDRSRSISNVVLTIISDILFTVAAILALYIVWQLWFTGIVAHQEQVKALETVEWDQPDDSNKPAVKLEGEPFCDVEPAAEKTMIGRIYIPRFGKEYSRNLVQGTNKIRVLDLQGFGHYEKTAMPGCVGNFSSAAHRDGYGEPLGKVEEISEGDALIVRTPKFWYVYKMVTSKVVGPENTSVIAPVPDDPKATPTERLLTFTTCHPRWSMAKRYIVHAKFDYWASVKSGVPQEMLDVGTTIRF